MRGYQDRSASEDRFVAPGPPGRDNNCSKCLNHTNGGTPEHFVDVPAVDRKALHAVQSHPDLPWCSSSQQALRCSSEGQLPQPSKEREAFYRSPHTVSCHIPSVQIRERIRPRNSPKPSLARDVPCPRASRQRKSPDAAPLPLFFSSRPLLPAPTCSLH